LGVSAVEFSRSFRDLRRAAQVRRRFASRGCRPPPRAGKPGRGGLGDSLKDRAATATVETMPGDRLSSFEARYGDPTTAFDYITVGIPADTTKSGKPLH